MNAITKIADALKSMKVDGPDTAQGCNYCGRGHSRDFVSDEPHIQEPSAEIDKFGYRVSDNCTICRGTGEDYKEHKLLIAGDGKGNGSVLEYRGWGPTMDIRESGLTDLGDMGLDEAPLGLSIFEATKYNAGGHYNGFTGDYSDPTGYEDGDFRELTRQEWDAIIEKKRLF
jgi:hypothetical protein